MHRITTKFYIGNTLSDSDFSHQQLNQDVHSDKLKLLYHQSFPAVFYSTAAALLFSAIIWTQIDSPILTMWIAAILLSSSFRLILFLAYRKKAPEGQLILSWEKPYFITLVFSSLVWGLGSLLITFNEPLFYQAVAYFFLIGMAGAALTVYSAIRYFAISTIAIILTPITIWFFLQGETSTTMMALACIMFLASAHRATRVLSNTLHKTFTLTHELTLAKEAAEHLAKTDCLTELNNRRSFTELSNQQLLYCKRHTHPVTLLLLDIDHFKLINDTYGHAVGDFALQHLAKILKTNTRNSDICCRLGGEEFAILLSNSNQASSISIAQKLLDNVKQQSIEVTGHKIDMTISIGLASNGYNLEQLLGQADKAMYQAKKAGRNQIITFDSSPTSNLPADN